jgi:hypothetical protein
MSTPTWPPECPQDQFVGVKTRSDENWVEFATDGGPSKRRRRATRERRYQTTPFEMNGAEVAVFELWWRYTMWDGVYSFTWKDMVTGVSRTFRFNSKPEFTMTVPADNEYDRIYECTLDLEIMD